MKILLSTTLTLLLTLVQLPARAQTTTVDQDVKVRIMNKSKFLITELKILGLNFQNIKSGESTGYQNVKPFYRSMKVDITIQRDRIFGRKLWYHTISCPIDYVGETLVTNEKNTLVINILKGENK